MSTLRTYRTVAGKGVLFGAYMSAVTLGALTSGAPVLAYYC